jgi:hypothetical protein
MNQKIELIDFSLISTYFGKYLTVFVTLVVFAITVSALLSNEADVGGVLKIAVTDGDSSHTQIESFESFGRLLSSQVRRAVKIVPYSIDEQDVDLYVMSLDQFIDDKQSLALVPLYSLADFPADEDNAVVITAVSNDTIAYDRLLPSEIAFTDSLSANGFWLQLEAIEKNGFHLPERMDQLRFEGAENHSMRVVLGVQWNRYTLGACSMSDIIFLENSGLLNRDEIRIVTTMDALPEMLFATTQEKADYFRDALEKVDEILRSPNASHGFRVAVAEMQASGFKRFLPVREDQLNRAEKLVQYLAQRF